MDPNPFQETDTSPLPMEIAETLKDRKQDVSNITTPMSWNTVYLRAATSPSSSGSPLDSTSRDSSPRDQNYMFATSRLPSRFSSRSSSRVRVFCPQRVRMNTTPVVQENGKLLYSSRNNSNLESNVHSKNPKAQSKNSVLFRKLPRWVRNYRPRKKKNQTQNNSLQRNEKEKNYFGNKIPNDFFSSSKNSFINLNQNNTNVSLNSNQFQQQQQQQQNKNYSFNSQQFHSSNSNINSHFPSQINNNSPISSTSRTSSFFSSQGSCGAQPTSASFSDSNVASSPPSLNQMSNYQNYSSSHYSSQNSDFKEKDESSYLPPIQTLFNMVDGTQSTI